MSLKQHADALLDGFQPPAFPKSLVGLVQITGLMGGPEVDQVSKALPGFTESAMCLKASDGYSWYRCLHFKVQGSEVCLALPWWQDWAKADGYQSDRSPAVYLADSAVPAEEVDSVIELLTAKLKEYKAEYDRKLEEQSTSSPDV